MGTCGNRASCRVLHTLNSAAVSDDTKNSDLGGADRLEGIGQRSCAAGESRLVSIYKTIVPHPFWSAPSKFVNRTFGDITPVYSGKDNN